MQLCNGKFTSTQKCTYISKYRDGVAERECSFGGLRNGSVVDREVEGQQSQ